MKLRNKLLLVFAVLMLVFSTSVFGAGIIVDGKDVEMESYQTDGKLLVTAESFDKLGLKVQENENEIELSNRNVKFIFTLNKNEVKVNDIEVRLDAPIVKVEDKSYLPLRFVLETLNYEVKWNDEANKVEAVHQNTLGYPIEIKLGEEVYSIEEAPKSLVSMAPSITERIFDLGIQDKLVARTDYCTYPEATKEIESVGSMYTPDLERIVGLKPEVVICETHFKAEALEKLREAGIPIISKASSQDFEGIYDYTLFIGRVFDKQFEARAMVAASKAKVSTVKYLISSNNIIRPRTYYSTGSGDYGEYGGPENSFIGKMIVLCGGDNIMKEQWREGNAIDWAYTVEDIVKNDPEVIFGGAYGAGAMKTNELFKEVSAIQNDKVYVDDQEMFAKATHRLLDDGIKELLSLLQPTLAEQLSF